MNYEKQYKEALERAKNIESLNLEYLTPKQVKEYIFPELKEDEDERIRKEIIGFIDRVLRDKNVLSLVADSIGDDIPNMAPCWIAYLEKMKEQKLVEIHNPTDAELDRHQKELHNFKVFAAKQAKEHHISFVHDFEWNNFCGELLSYFNEQKPAEYPNKDEIYAIMTKLINLSYSQLIPINSAEYKQIHEIISDFRSLIDYPIEQKSVEWNEDDSMLMYELESYILYDKELNDEQKLWRIKRLKSLRPQSHWKPSEEQMGALNYAYCELFKREDVGHNILSPLQNLMDTLSKL